MVVTDYFADLIIRIKNAYLARKRNIIVPWSKKGEKLIEILVKEGYLKNAKLKTQDSKFKVLELGLKYEGKEPAFKEAKIISKPGLRIYTKANQIPRVKESKGITIVSTPKGLMTDKQARKDNQGGELICQIW
jgi:small subunit ribosomal protein S8